MSSYKVTGSINTEIHNLGTFGNGLCGTKLMQVGSALEASEGLHSISVLADIREDLLTLTVSKVNSTFTNSFAISNRISMGLSPLRTMLGQAQVEGPVYIHSNWPLELSSQFTGNRCLGVLHAYKNFGGHTSWLLLEFNDLVARDSQQLKHAQATNSVLAVSGHALLRDVCCFDIDCDPLQLKQCKISTTLDGQLLVDETPSPTSRSLASAFAKLDQFEHRILELMAEGRPNGEIANILYVSASSIRNASSKIYNKIGARNRQEAVVLHTQNQYLLEKTR